MSSFPSKNFENEYNEQMRDIEKSSEQNSPDKE